MSEERYPEARYMNHWLGEAGRTDGLFLPGEGHVVQLRGAISPSHFLFQDEQHRLVLGRPGVLRNTLLAQFVGKRRDLGTGRASMLLNGDGLRGAIAQGVQARLRARTHSFPNLGMLRTLIIPFRALTAAEIDFDSIERIFVTGDQTLTQRFPVGPPPPVTPEMNQKLHEARQASSPTWGHTLLGNVEEHNGRAWRYSYDRNQRSAAWHVLFAAPNGAAGWLPTRENNGQRTVSAAIHRLGSCCFSAIGPDGQRHRYLSAFDEMERNPAMYYLAQLPDEGDCSTYRRAVNLLAPPLVHQAWKEGRNVRRQGDIFAIPTDLTTADVYADAIVTRRTQVLVVRRRNGADEWVFKRGIHRAFRERIMIYGTAHTATIVARKPNGVTFVKGTLFHDPILEQRGRTREHHNVQLGKVWHLCVRNTVPRA